MKIFFPVVVFATFYVGCAPEPRAPPLATSDDELAVFGDVTVGHGTMFGSGR